MINKDKIKGYIAGLSTAILLCSTVTFAQTIEKTVTAVYNNIKIMIDGTQIVPKDANGNVVEPFIIDGTTYLPVRAVASMLGQDVNWDGSTNTVYIGKMPAPANKTQYSVSTEIMNAFADTALLKVADSEVPGSFYNFYIAQSANDASLQYICDNYSPDATLQTMTIDSVPVAKALADEVTVTFHSLFAVYNEAVKSGFANQASTKEQLDIAWGNFTNQFESEAEMAEFFASCAVKESDIRKFSDVNAMYSLYLSDINAKNESKTYTPTELYNFCKSNYAKVKHILVEDEQTAKDIIAKIKKGTSFDSLVEEYSIDPGQGKDGYTFTKGEMVAQFEEASFALRENSYTTTPVKTNYGYHIIYRYPIEKTWITENESSLKSAIAFKKTNETLSSIIENAKLTYTDNYEKYITTIE